MKSSINDQLTDTYPRLVISKHGAVYLQKDISCYILLHPETGSQSKRGKEYYSIAEPKLYIGELTISN